MSVCENMTIDITFTNLNTTMGYEDIVSKLRRWVDAELIAFLQYTDLHECIYLDSFSYYKYVPMVNGLTATITVENASIKDINEVGNILLQKIPVIRFPTRTSIQFNTYGFRTYGSYYKLLYLLEYQDFLTENIIQKNLLPIAHVGLNTERKTAFITISNAFNYRNLMFNFYYILYGFDKLDKKFKDTSDLNTLTFENIRKRSLKYEKKTLLKVLLMTDPRLFGSRNVKGTIRPYSGLSQQQNQRVIPLTYEEYNIVKAKAPNTIINVQNQTYPDQRLYLYCPWTDTKFINFHSFPGQLCTVKCTTKASNKSQINYCVNQLGVSDMIFVDYKYENQTITLYNPLLSVGRKCKVPSEIMTTFFDYILLKLPIKIHDVEHYCMDNYQKHSFIIQRDPKTQAYRIFSDFNVDYDYILILQSELNDECFLFIEDKFGTPQPMTLDKNPILKNFFIENIHKTKNQVDFFNYLRGLLKIDIENM